MRGVCGVCGVCGTNDSRHGESVLARAYDATNYWPVASGVKLPGDCASPDQP